MLDPLACKHTGNLFGKRFVFNGMQVVVNARRWQVERSGLLFLQTGDFVGIYPGCRSGKTPAFGVNWSLEMIATV